MEIIDTISCWLTDYLLVWLLLAAAIYFTWRTRGVQFTMIGEMIRLLLKSGQRSENVGHTERPSHGNVSSFQAFALSIASRVGTGNLAGVATAVAVGGPGAIFWMWVIALLGASSAFVESTLAQLFKVKGRDSFMGGPAYYILKGLHQRWWAVTFAVLITLTFGMAFNSVQSNTISQALDNSFGVPPLVTAVVLGAVTLIVIWGGIHRVSRFSEVVVPIMAVAYIVLALVIMAMNITRVPEVFMTIIDSAFGVHQAVGGAVGTAIIMGVKRGLFSNEAGEGSTPNAAATATVSHPVKQGLIQALGVYTDTLLVCSATAFIILCSGIYANGSDGIALTQQAIDQAFGGTNLGSVFVSIAVLFFAFTSIVANYYYGENNLRFIRDNRVLINAYRLIVTAMVVVGALASLKTVWQFADITMALMTICNISAIVPLGKYAVTLLADYRLQRRAGVDPVYRAGTLPEIADETRAWQ